MYILLVRSLNLLRFWLLYHLVLDTRLGNMFSREVQLGVRLLRLNYRLRRVFRFRSFAFLGNRGDGGWRWSLVDRGPAPLLVDQAIQIVVSEGPLGDCGKALETLALHFTPYTVHLLLSDNSGSLHLVNV